MTCSRCQQTIPDGSVYCPYCGEACGATPPPAPTPDYQPPVSYAPPVNYPSPVAPANPVIEAFRSVASSPLLLVAVILLSVSIVLSFLAVGENMVSLNEVFGELGEVVNSSELNELLGEVGNLEVSTGNSVGSIWNILLAVGLWMTFASAKKQQSTIATGGLTMVWVVSIISLISTCLLVALVAILSVVLALLVAGSEGGAFAATLAVVLLLLFGGIFAFAIVCEVKQMKTINVARQTLTTGLPSDKVSMLVIVMAIIAGGVQVLSGLDFLTAPLSSLSNAAYGVSTILLAVVGLNYRRAMRQLMAAAPVMPYAPVAPAYSVPTPVSVLQPVQPAYQPPAETPEE